jgi:hypothetical protein
MGDDVAVSGVATNEVDDVSVTAIDQQLCLYINATDCYEIHHLTYVSKSGTDIIQPGDSGGPVISGIGGTGNANGAGDISGFFADDGSPDYTRGFYTQIGDILSEVNGTLLRE